MTETLKSEVWIRLGLNEPLGQTQQILYSLCAADISHNWSGVGSGMRCKTYRERPAHSRDLATFFLGQATHAQPVAPGASTLCPFRKIDKIRLLGFTTLHDTRRYAIPQRQSLTKLGRGPGWRLVALVVRRTCEGCKITLDCVFARCRIRYRDRFG